GFSGSGGSSGPGMPGPPSESSGSSGSRPVSIRDVAAAAGVSYQTVSRVINGHPSVKGSTRDLVLATITRLGFRPNRAARALAGGPIQSVTVLTARTTLYGQRSAIQGIEEAARAADFALGVRVIESEDPAVVADAVERAVESGGALIVVAFDRAGTRALAAVPPGVPMVGIVETPVGDEGDGKPWVWINDRQAAAEATRYLLGLGHRTVHYLSIPPSTDASPQRLAGWQSALAEAGAAVPEPVQAGWHPRSGYEAGRVLATDPSVTAVLCGNDDLALGVIRAMREAGRPIPDSVSVVGFDDIPQAEFYTPALTTVRLDFTELGRASFALLLELVGKGGEARPRPRPELVVRESSGPPVGGVRALCTRPTCGGPARPRPPGRARAHGSPAPPAPGERPPGPAPAPRPPRPPRPWPGVSASCCAPRHSCCPA
ncbi:MAG TPA: LacI family DNA-binding transcriptional regulator, partial [Streptosporangiaceae bacterium]|nr:LacI family DNA-binding transcriptional regulator [Streptosporangiaceae bacterium]